MGKISEYDKVTTVANSDTFLLEGTDGTKGITGENLAKSMKEMGGGISDFSDYDKVTTVSNSDTFLLEGTEGVKGITAENLSKSIIEMGGNPEAATPDFYAMIDELNKPELHRTIYRGKNFGKTVTDEQKQQISSGRFKDLFLGDYWQTEGPQIWRIWDFDYWFDLGEEAITKHHLVIMPDWPLYEAKMNSTATTEGGYVGSQMYTTNLEQAKTIINSVFGEAYIHKHGEYLINAVTNGRPSGGAWFDSTVELPSEIMMYGSRVLTPAYDGTKTINIETINKNPLALAAIAPGHNVVSRYKYCWLRDVASSMAFTAIGAYGQASAIYTQLSNWVRPVFGITG